jgi:hypothetical protein
MDKMGTRNMVAARTPEIQAETQTSAQKGLCIQALEGYMAELERKKVELNSLMTRQYPPKEMELFFIDLSMIMKVFCEQIKGFDEIFALTPWGTLSHVRHNLGGSALHTLRLFLGSGMEEEAMRLENAIYFIEQTIAHIRCILHILEAREEEKPESKSQVVDAHRISLRARILDSSSLLRIPGVTDTYKLFRDAPLVRAFCDAGLQTDIPLHELIEIFYVPISNADRVMGNVKIKDKTVSNLRMDVSARELKHEGMKYLVFECFNTGKLVDLTALHKKIMEMDESAVGAVSGDLFRTVQAIKRGSRQAHLRVDESVLIMDGLTLESGGTGIGLADLHRQLDLKNGLILLNNVYHPTEEGFCVTILFPETGGTPTRGLQRKLRRVKEYLASGKLFIERQPEEAKIAKLKNNTKIEQ